MHETDIYALIGALIFCAVYAFADSIRLRLGAGYKRRWAATGAGVSLAYVFIDVVPELAERSEVIREAAVHAFNPIKRIYVITLLGMLTFVALAHLGVKSSKEREEHDYQVANWYFLVHVGGFALYNVLIGFLAVGRAQVSIASLCVYVFAIALHMVMIDGTLTETHGSRYTNWGRKALAAGVLIGWALATTDSLSELAFTRLFAFLAGGIVITSANEEYPREDQGRFWYFVGGALLYAQVLVLV